MNTDPRRKAAPACARYFGVLILAMLPMACAHVPGYSWLKGEDAEPAPQAQRDGLEDIRQWSATGRIAIDTGEEAWNTSLHWRQRHDDYRIRLNAPLASGSAEIMGGPEGVTLRTSDHRSFSAPDPESLLSEAMGWYIPVGGLRYWILGLPEPGAPVDRATRDESERLRQLEQSGWKIRYLDYRRVEGFYLPVWLALENERLSARIRVGAWTLGDSPRSELPMGRDYRGPGHDGRPRPAPARAISRTISRDTSLPAPTSASASAPEKEEPAKSKCGEKGGMYAIPLLGGVLCKILPSSDE